MTGPAETVLVLSATAMMAISPVSGSGEGRVLQLCHPDGSARKILVWDDEAPLSGPNASKACHACVIEKRKPRRGKK